MMYPIIHTDLAPFTKEDKLRHFAPLPLGVLRMGLRPSAVLVYAELLNRATLSQRNGWCDRQGWVFVSYSVPNLALNLRMGESTIREIFRVLENQELIFRTYPLAGERSEIYLRVPQSSLEEPKNLPYPSGITDPMGIRATTPEYYKPPYGDLDPN